MHFGRKADLSSDEETEAERLNAVTFDERLSLEFRERNDRNVEAAQSGRVHLPQPSQSDWI